MNELNKSGLSAVIHYLEIMNQFVQPPLYTAPLPVLRGATLGQHVRHIHDFYKAIALGYRDEKIDYNCRERNEAIELSLEIAIQQLNGLNHFFSALDYDRKLFVIASEGYDAKPILIQTVFQRELMYAYDHAIHHLALIRIGFESVHDVSLPASFGVARSTLSHLKKQ